MPSSCRSLEAERVKVRVRRRVRRRGGLSEATET